MTEFQQEMQLIEHYRNRLDNKIEACDCCEDMDFTEIRETLCEITEFWGDIERDTY